MSEPYYISEKHKQDIKMTLCTIVGMGPGIGYALARRFGREGLEIGMIARNEEHLQHYELSFVSYTHCLYAYNLYSSGDYSIFWIFIFV